MRKKAPIQHDFFTVIDSEVKAYLLGFYMGDGNCSIRKRGNSTEYSLRIGVIEEDRYIVNLCQEHIAPFSKIVTRPSFLMEKDGKQYTCRQQVSLNLYSEELVKAYQSWGFGPNNTKREKRLPAIPEENLRHFIRGYFDADGTCTNNLTKRSDRPSDTLRAKSIFHIPSWDRTILESIKEYLDKKLGINLRIYDYTGKKIHYLKSSCLAEIHKLHSFFYDDATYFFQRKKESFELTMLTPRELRTLKGAEPRNA